MSDVSYSVLVDLKAKDSGVRSAMGSLRSEIGSVTQAAAGIFTGAVESVMQLAGAAGIGALGAAVAGVTYGVTSLNNELEKTQISLGAIFKANGAAANMGVGMQLASDMMAKMREDAAALPGEYTDLIGIFRSVAIPGLRAGATPERLEKLSANIMAAGAVANLPMDMVAREAGMLVSGHAGGHNVLGRTLFGLQGDEAKKFNAQSSGNQLAFLEANFAKYSDSIAVFANSFDAQKSTLTQYVKTFISDATLGVFNRVKSTLADMNAWYENNRATVDHWAQAIGEKLVTAFDWGRAKIEEWWPVLHDFAEKAGAKLLGVWERVEPLVEKVAKTLKESMADGSMLDKIETILKLYAAVKIGGAVAGSVGSVASPIMSVLSTGALMTMARGGIAGGAGEAAAVGGAGEVASVVGGVGVTGLAGLAIAVAVAAFGASIVGAANILGDKSHPMHADATRNVENSLANLNSALGIWSTSFEKLGQSAKSVSDFMGGVLLSGLESATVEMRDFSVNVHGVMEGISAFFDTNTSFADWVANQFKKPHLAHEDTALPIERSYDLGGRLVRSAGFAEPAVAKTPLAHPPSGTTIQKVEIVVSSNADPSRIARFVKAELLAVNKNPTHGNARDWSRP